MCSRTKQNADAYVSRVYSTDSLREIYAGEVMPIPMPDDWIVPEEVSSRIVNAPVNPSQAGRPRVSRMTAGSQTSRTVTCSRCFARGHYRSTCTATIHMPIEEASASASANQGVPKRRKPKRCSVCGEAGHTRPKCMQGINE